jgi:hypothetical protein
MDALLRELPPRLREMQAIAAYAGGYHPHDLMSLLVDHTGWGAEQAATNSRYLEAQGTVLRRLSRTVPFSEWRRKGQFVVVRVGEVEVAFVPGSVGHAEDDAPHQVHSRSGGVATRFKTSVPTKKLARGTSSPP